MSKIVVDEIQKSGGVALTLPTADGTSGQTLQTDGSGNLSFQTISVPTVQTCKFSKAFALTGGGGQSSYNATNRIMWDDIVSGISLDDILQVEITGVSAATGNFDLYAIGADSSGNAITSGYLGYGSNDYYNGNNETNSDSHNSNNGWVWWPQYQEVYGEGQNSYGYGMMWTYKLCPHSYGSNGGHWHHIWYAYQQNTSYNHPNYGQIAWNNYSTSSPPADWHGVHIYPNSGSWVTNNNNNVVVVELITNNV